MVQAALLQTLILSSVFCMVLCSDNAPAPPTDAIFPDDAATKNSTANSTVIPTLGSPTESNSTKLDPTASDDTTTNNPKPDGKASAMHGPSTVSGVLSVDGKCTCPGVPPVLGVPPVATSDNQTGSTPPPVTPDNTTSVSSNDTSSTNFIKAPTNLCFLAISAVVGINALIA
ncbi:hypothetical protein DFH28DRAFT_931850 [Melampsora americana]|nr:hypothetical protein DFH28DRAFT_931850 [Melampsora americana]